MGGVAFHYLLGWEGVGGNGSAWVCKHPVVDGLDCSALQNQGSNRERTRKRQGGMRRCKAQGSHPKGRFMDPYVEIIFLGGLEFQLVFWKN